MCCYCHYCIFLSLGTRLELHRPVSLPRQKSTRAILVVDSICLIKNEARSMPGIPVHCETVTNALRPVNRTLHKRARMVFCLGSLSFVDMGTQEGVSHEGGDEDCEHICAATAWVTILPRKIPLNTVPDLI